MSKWQTADAKDLIRNNSLNKCHLWLLMNEISNTTFFPVKGLFSIFLNRNMQLTPLSSHVNKINEWGCNLKYCAKHIQTSKLNIVHQNKYVL